MSDLLTIAKVSAETGIAKEVLRKWEVRYGFPIPVRDEGGNRLYPADQVKRLALVRRLIDRGMRPSHVVSLDVSELACLAEQTQGEGAEAMAALHHVADWLRTRDPHLIRNNLYAELQKAGLRTFVLEIMPAMNILVGNGWEKGALAVRDEHLYTEIVQSLLREALGAKIHPEGRPRILLATPPGEAHVLGILMVEASLTVEGAYCISLGPQVPLDEMALAAQDFRTDVLALSFSMHFPKKKIAPLLKTIRSSLSPAIELWAGGLGVKDLEPVPRGVSVFNAISDATAALERCRKRLRLS